MGTIKCVFGTPTSTDIRALKKELSEVLNDDNAQRTCILTSEEKDIHFAFYWRAE